jgi:hypothetical protein
MAKLLTFKCNECEFSTTSEKGLKTHKKKMHDKTKTTEDCYSFPKQCDLCEKEIKNILEMKVHMKTHSYKKAEFKCEDCEYCSETKLTMEVHLGKEHDPNFECGLCGFVATTLENLELHLFTCEIYICDSCRLRFKSIPDLKKHLHDVEHRIVNPKYYTIFHAKQGKTSESEIKSNTYYKEDFISQKKKK